MAQYGGSCCPHGTLWRVSWLICLSDVKWAAVPLAKCAWRAWDSTLLILLYIRSSKQLDCLKILDFWKNSSIATFHPVSRSIWTKFFWLSASFLWCFCYTHFRKAHHLLRTFRWNDTPWRSRDPIQRSLGGAVRILQFHRTSAHRPSSFAVNAFCNSFAHRLWKLISHQSHRILRREWNMWSNKP